MSVSLVLTNEVGRCSTQDFSNSVFLISGMFGEVHGFFQEIVIGPSCVDSVASMRWTHLIDIPVIWRHH